MAGGSSVNWLPLHCIGRKGLYTDYMVPIDFNELRRRHKVLDLAKAKAPLSDGLYVANAAKKLRKLLIP